MDNFRNFTAKSSYGRHAMSLHLTSAVGAAENQSMPRRGGANFGAASLRLSRPAIAARPADSAAAAESLRACPSFPVRQTGHEEVLLVDVFDRPCGQA
jgi:hypothetical protein